MTVGDQSVYRENFYQKAYHVFSEFGGNLSWDMANLRIHDIVDTDRIGIILIVRIPFGGDMLSGSGNAIVEADPHDLGIQSSWPPSSAFVIFDNDF